MTNQHQITLKAEVDSLEKLWEFISTSCTEHDLAGEIAGDIQLAVDEAFSNIIAHGYAGLVTGEMSLCLQFEADRVQVEVTDQGRGFEPAEIPQPDIDAPMAEREPGGLGWFLIHQLMDEVTYSRMDSVNRLVFTKRLDS